MYLKTEEEKNKIFQELTEENCTLILFIIKSKKKKKKIKYPVFDTV